MNDKKNQQINCEESYFLNDLIGTRVYCRGKKIGFLADIVVCEKSGPPQVTHLYVGRLFGNPALLIPWENVRSITSAEIVVHIEDTTLYEREPDESLIKLKDHILDKKVLDTEDREVDVVYDIRLALAGDRLYVCDVDISMLGLLRRIGMGWLAKALRKGPDKEKLISWKYIQNLPTPIGRFRGDVRLKILKERLDQIHPVDLADILEELDTRQRAAVFEELDTHKASATFEEIDPKSQRELVAVLKKEKIVQLLSHMTSGQAADILSILPYSEMKTFLKLLGEQHAKKIRAIMERQEENVVNFSTSRFITFPPTTTVKDVRDHFQDIAKGKRIVMYIYIVDGQNTLLGVVDVKDLLLAGERKTLMEIKTPRIISLRPDNTLKDALHLFERYYYRALPIVDTEGKIVGVLPYRDLKRIKHRFLE
jgi:CBS domain-containing protein/sporulation protein YlmC with PRC-barrel domain